MNLKFENKINSTHWAHSNTVEGHENGTRYWRSRMSQRRHLSICCLFVEGQCLTERTLKIWKMQILLGSKKCSWKHEMQRSASRRNNTRTRVIVKCSSVIFHLGLTQREAERFVRRLKRQRGRPPGFSVSMWAPRSGSDHHCQESTGVWQETKTQSKILECGASGLTAGVEITQEAKKVCERGRQREGERENTSYWISDDGSQLAPKLVTVTISKLHNLSPQRLSLISVWWHSVR